MFAECSLVMFAVQAVLFSPLVAPALAILGAGLFALPMRRTSRRNYSWSARLRQALAF
jgi:Flp pilus assembly protein TadB